MKWLISIAFAWPFLPMPISTSFQPWAESKGLQYPEGSRAERNVRTETGWLANHANDTNGNSAIRVIRWPTLLVPLLRPKPTEPLRDGPGLPLN